MVVEEEEEKEEVEEKKEKEEEEKMEGAGRRTKGGRERSEGETTGYQSGRGGGPKGETEA